MTSHSLSKKSEIRDAVEGDRVESLHTLASAAIEFKVCIRHADSHVSTQLRGHSSRKSRVAIGYLNSYLVSTFAVTSGSYVASGAKNCRNYFLRKWPFGAQSTVACKLFESLLQYQHASHNALVSLNHLITCPLSRYN